MGDISLGTQKFRGSNNFQIAMIQELATQLLGKNVTASESNGILTISQGGTELIQVNIGGGGGTYPWADIASLLFTQATIQDIHVGDRTTYHENFSRGIDWRDMSQSTTINNNRFADSNLTISVNNAAFTIDGFGANSFDKLIGVQLQRNDGNTSYGAMIEYGNGQPFLRIDENNVIQVNGAIDGAGGSSWQNVADANGNLVLAGGANDFLIIEIIESNPEHPDNNFDVIVGYFDGTTYHRANNNFITINGVDGDDLGFSRSTSQRGQVLRFKAINLPAYISHHDLELLLRNHRDDKWVYGFVTNVRGGTFREVAFNTRVDLAAGSTLNNNPISTDKAEVKVYLATGIGTGDGQLTDLITLPTNYANYGYVHVSEYDTNTTEFRHALIPIDVLNIATTTDNLRLQGDSDLRWNSSTRQLTLDAGVQEIFRVTLRD